MTWAVDRQFDRVLNRPILLTLLVNLACFYPSCWPWEDYSGGSIKLILFITVDHRDGNHCLNNEVEHRKSMEAARLKMPWPHVNASMDPGRPPIDRPLAGGHFGLPGPPDKGPPPKNTVSFINNLLRASKLGRNSLLKHLVLLIPPVSVSKWVGIFSTFMVPAPATTILFWRHKSGNGRDIINWAIIEVKIS